MTMKQFYPLLLAAVILFLSQNTALANRECDNLEKLVVKAVKTAEVSGGCAGIGLAFESVCSAASAAEGAPECTVGAVRLSAVCTFFGGAFVANQAKDIAADVCDYIYPDTDPYILVENHLQKHKIDFRAVINKAGDDVHLRGNNWLKGEDIGILSSHKLEGENFHGLVKAKVKIGCDESLLPSHPNEYAKSCKDKLLKIHKVKPNKHRVYVNHKDGQYQIHKKELKKSFGPFIPIENHLKNHKIAFSVLIDNSPDVHLPGDNDLKPKEKATLYSYKLYKDSYTVKARIKKMGSDITKTIDEVTPGLHKVYVSYKNGKYNIHKKKITSKFYTNRTIPVENHLKKHMVDFRVDIDNGPDVHLVGKNWLAGDKKGLLMDHRLYKNSYTVKARVKRDGKIDSHLEKHDVHPGKHKVYVYFKNGKYHIGKEAITQHK